VKTVQEKLDLCKIVGKTLAFPEVTLFADLFSVIPDLTESKIVSYQTPEGKTSTNGTRTWIWGSIGGKHRSFHVQPTDDVMRYITDTDVVGGSKYFQITDRGDNVSLVTVVWDQIIASRWLAFIDTDSIPEAKE
jgi:hypothetical protein